MISRVFKNSSVCRICRSKNLIRVFSNEPSPIGEAFIKKKKVDVTQKKYPIDVLLCGKCGLSQLSKIINPEILYKKYLYYSKTSNDLLKHFSNFSKYLFSRFKIHKNDLIVDVGSNDGMLLNCFKNYKCAVIGIEPSSSQSKIANKKGIKTLNSFFDKKTAKFILSHNKKPKIITACNVIANIDDLNAVFKNIEELLADDGIFVFESFYLLDLIKNNVFDFIYHEHLSLFGIKPIQYLCKLYNLELFDTQRIKTKGGSLRFFIRKKKTNNISYRMKKLIKEETRSNLYSKEIFIKFRKNINFQKKKLIIALKKAVLTNKSARIVGFGASISCITLIYDFGLENKIKFLLDDNSLKHNWLSPGSNIKVINPKKFIFTKNDIILFLAWRFQKFFINKYKKLFFKNNYRIFQLLPKFKLIYSN
jgi:SAM-dependent methyltransferase